MKLISSSYYWSKSLKTAKIFDHGFHRYHGWESSLFYP